MAALLFGAFASLPVHGIERAAAQDNPFDLQPQTESTEAPAPAEKETKTKTFYRAGKEIQGKVEPATRATETTPASGSPFDMIEKPASQEEPELQETQSIQQVPVETAVPDEQADKPTADEEKPEAKEEVDEKAGHAAAPKSGMSTFDMIQYASIAVACFGGLFVFMMMRKKKRPISAVPAPAPQASGGAPVDSERVKKALAAFHDDAAAKAAAA